VKTMDTEYMRSLVVWLPKGRRFFVLLWVLVYFAFPVETRSVSPAPDGGYPNGNTAEGNGALFSLTNGLWNTALGQQTLYNNTSGYYNTAVGLGALFKNATAGANTATGVYALFSNSTGYYNSAEGYQALARNTTGFRNAAFGANALYNHGSGNFNNAVGAFALHSDTTGSTNNAFGESALAKNTSGADNTAIGDDALWGNTTGNSNIALGSQAGRSLTTGSNNIDIGNFGVPGESHTIRIGTSGDQTRTFIAGIYGATGGGSKLPVYINSSGQLGTQSSSHRFKKEIKPMDQKSEAILALKPVTFRYKSDNANTPQFGLVAEDVAEVDPDLVVRDDTGSIYTVRYEAVNAMLLNEFLKEHNMVQELKATITQQQRQIEAVTAGLQQLTEQLLTVQPQGANKN
jgi:trimeric autotransporter adhesin